MALTKGELKARHYSMMVIAVHDVFRTMLSSRMDREESYKYLDKHVYSHPSHRKMGATYRTMLSGLIQECRERHLQQLVWCFYIGGHFVSSKDAEKLPTWPGWKGLEGDKSSLCYPPTDVHKEYKPY